MHFITIKVAIKPFLMFAHIPIMNDYERHVGKMDVEPPQAQVVEFPVMNPGNYNLSGEQQPDIAAAC